jgi:hypothetical protein
VAVEPSFVALGPKHIAVGMNNHCWFYTSDTGGAGKDGSRGKNDDGGGGGGGSSTKGKLVSERQYVSSVTACRLNR